MRNKRKKAESCLVSGRLGGDLSAAEKRYFIDQTLFCLEGVKEHTKSLLSESGISKRTRLCLRDTGQNGGPGTFR